jgi:hypothetical protein
MARELLAAGKTARKINMKKALAIFVFIFLSISFVFSYGAMMFLLANSGKLYGVSIGISGRCLSDVNQCRYRVLYESGT